MPKHYIEPPITIGKLRISLTLFFLTASAIAAGAAYFLSVPPLYFVAGWLARSTWVFRQPKADPTPRIVRDILLRN